MKPIRLTMSAFGSYAEKMVLEFDQVQQGLFLITGDTGAGKTTIFDAVMYALYDQTSGGRREGNMMRSQYAGEDTETYVEYCFSYRQEVYTIRRNPEYFRTGKRRMADGTPRLVKEAAKVELFMPDQTVFKGKKRETDQQIVEIIGLDASQFTQIAMIAQGDFLKLLHAESKERKFIFSKIFQTRLYYRIQEELKKRSTELYIRLEDNQKDIRREMERVECAENSQEAQAWQELKNQQLPSAKEVTEVLGQLLEKEKKQEVKLSEQAGSLQQNADELHGSIKEAETVNQMFAACEQAEAEQERLEEKRPEYVALQEAIADGTRAEQVWAAEEKKKEAARSAEKASAYVETLRQQEEETQLLEKELRLAAKQQEQLFAETEPHLSKETVLLKETLEQYRQLEELKKYGKGMEQQLSKQQDKVMQIEAMTADLEVKQSRMQMRQEALQESPARAEQLMAKLAQNGRRLSELKELKAYMVKNKQTEKCYEQAVKQAAQDQELYQKALLVYEETYQAFLKEQSGVLAKELQPESPCPVCGSLHHPKKAVLPPHAPTQRAVEKAKKQRDQAEAVRDASNRIGQEQAGIRNTETELIHRAYESLLQKPYEAHGAEKVEAELQICLSSEKQVQEELRKVNADRDELLELKTALAGLAQKVVEQQEALRKEKDLYTIAKVRQQERIADIRAKEEKLPYASQQEAENRLTQAQKQLFELKKAVTDAQKNYQEQQQFQMKLAGEKKSESQHQKQREEEYKAAQNVYKEVLFAQGFSDEQAYFEKKHLIESLAESKVRTEQYERSRQQQAAVLQSLEVQLAGKKRRDVAALTGDAERIREQLAVVTETQMQLHTRNQKNQEVLDKLTHYFEQQASVREVYEITSNLSRTANGGLSGAVKLDFETYIQRWYFKEIIHAANKRLYQMNGGDFLLSCREVKDLKSQGQSGLDLDIYHMLSGTVRDVRTLSGGESFMAALSMALGLADIIMNTAGAIQLDTMFVDEGFGSLDDTSRELAMRVLRELAGEKRLVGIISHVNELKEQIDCKLLITKSEKGSSARWSFS